MMDTIFIDLLFKMETTKTQQKRLRVDDNQLTKLADNDNKSKKNKMENNLLSILKKLHDSKDDSDEKYEKIFLCLYNDTLYIMLVNGNKFAIMSTVNMTDFKYHCKNKTTNDIVRFYVIKDTFIVLAKSTEITLDISDGKQLGVTDRNCNCRCNDVAINMIIVSDYIITNPKVTDDKTQKIYLATQAIFYNICMKIFETDKDFDNQDNIPLSSIMKYIEKINFKISIKIPEFKTDIETETYIKTMGFNKKVDDIQTIQLDGDKIIKCIHIDTIDFKLFDMDNHDTNYDKMIEIVANMIKTVADITRNINNIYIFGACKSKNLEEFLIYQQIDKCYFVMNMMVYNFIKKQYEMLTYDYLFEKTTKLNDYPVIFGSEEFGEDHFSFKLSDTEVTVGGDVITCIHTKNNLFIL